jgi:hypothetical protein
VAKRGRPPVLDELKQRDIVTIVAIGCSQRTAARYVGCAPSTIFYTAEHNERFAEKLEHAKGLAVVMHVKNINSAAKKAQYWRAAAWALERLIPEEYAAPKPDSVTTDQIKRLMAFLSQIIVEEVPIGRYRKNIIKRLNEIENMIETFASGRDARNKTKLAIRNDADTESQS